MEMKDMGKQLVDIQFLERFFWPESIAVVGASNNPLRLNYSLVANLVKLGFKGRIYPVNPKEKKIPPFFSDFHFIGGQKNYSEWR